MMSALLRMTNSISDFGYVRDVPRSELRQIPEVSRNSPLHDAIELNGRELCEHVAFCGIGVVARDFSLTVDHQSSL